MGAVEGTVTDLSARNSSERQSEPHLRPHESPQRALGSFGYPGKARGPHDLAWRSQIRSDAAPNKREPASAWPSLAASRASVQSDRSRSQPLSYSARRWIGKFSVPPWRGIGRRHRHALGSSASTQTLRRPERALSGSSAAAVW